MPMVLTDGGNDAFERLAIDIYGPISRPNEKPNSQKYVLTAISMLTKYSFAIPMAKITSEAIAIALVEKIFCQVGCPKYIISDNAKYFSVEVNKQLAKLFGIQHVFCSIYYPMGNASLERSHMSLAEYLKFFISQEKNWVKYLTYAMWAFNTSKCESTKYTPFELVYGKQCRLITSFPTAE